MNNTITIKIEAPEIVQAITALAEAISGKPVTNTQSVQATTATNVQAPVATVPTVQVSQPPVQNSYTVPTTPPVAAVPTVQVNQPPVATVPPQQPVSSPYVAPTAPTSTPAYTIEQLQTAIAPLLDAGKVQQIQQLVQSFGVATLMDIPKERYGEFANGLRSLGGVL